MAPTFVDEATGETKPTLVLTDGWPSYNGVGALGYLHLPILQTRHGQPTGEWLPLVHLVFSNLKRWLMGTHKGAVLPKCENRSIVITWIGHCDHLGSEHRDHLDRPS